MYIHTLNHTIARPLNMMTSMHFSVQSCINNFYIIPNGKWTLIAFVINLAFSLSLQLC